MKKVLNVLLILAPPNLGARRRLPPLPPSYATGLINNIHLISLWTVSRCTGAYHNCTRKADRELQGVNGQSYSECMNLQRTMLDRRCIWGDSDLDRAIL